MAKLKYRKTPINLQRPSKKIQLFYRSISILLCCAGISKQYIREHQQVVKGFHHDKGLRFLYQGTGSN